MQGVRGKVAAVGVGYAIPTRNPEHSLGADTISACAKAIADAGLTIDDIDGVSSYPDQPYGNAGNLDGVDLVTPNWLTAAMGLKNVAWSHRDNIFVGSSFIQAINAVAAGSTKCCLVWRSLTFPKGQRYGQTDPGQATGPSQWEYPYGYTGPGPASRAVMYRRYMEKYGATREHMATHIVNNRNNALLNEKGYWYNHRPEVITVDDYLNSRMVSDPFCLYDCDIPVHGCAAWILTTADRAKEAPNGAAYVVGTAQGVSVRDVTLGPLEVDQAGVARVSKRLWERTGLSPKDIDTANLYDGFSVYVYINLEGYGFCKEGEAFEWIQDGRIELGGELPFNTSGGNSGEGRLHGATHISEAILQAMHRAGPRQVKDATLTLSGIGVPGASQAVIYSHEPL